MNYNVFSTFARKFASLASSIDHDLVIDGSSNIPESKMPKASYCSVFIGNKIPYGSATVHSEFIKNGSDVVGLRQDVIKTKTVDVLFSFYRDHARTFADSIQNSSESDSILEFLFMSGVGVVKIGNSVPLPKLKSSRYEERASITVTFSLNESFSENVGVIKKVELIIQDINSNFKKQI